MHKVLITLLKPMSIHNTTIINWFVMTFYLKAAIMEMNAEEPILKGKTCPVIIVVAVINFAPLVSANLKKNADLITMINAFSKLKNL